jgi:putative hydrolase of the HAD superfamily
MTQPLPPPPRPPVSFQAVVFDLDNTLYPADNGLFTEVERRILLFFTLRLGIAPDAAARLRKDYRRRYHLTICGLMAERGVDPEEFMSFVHDVPVEEHLSPDPELRGLLEEIPCRRAVLTNGSLRHARRVLEALGVDDLFADVCDLAATGYVPKPEPVSYRRAAELWGISLPRSIYVDDLPANVRGALALGMTGILLSAAPPPPDLPHVAADRAALRTLLADLAPCARP